MEENEGRKMFINELLIDDLERTPYYSKSNISERLETFFQLKLKVEKNDILKKEVEDQIKFYEEELNRKEGLFKELKARKYYEKPSERRKRKEKESRKKQRKEEARLRKGPGLM